jgi:hypothetical protein
MYQKRGLKRGKDNFNFYFDCAIRMDSGIDGGRMTQKKIFHTLLLDIWITFDSFGFGVTLDIDYAVLIIRVGAIVFVLGRGYRI